MSPINWITTSACCLLVICIIVGCIPIMHLPESGEPDAFRENLTLIDSLYGSTSDEIDALVGQPNWIKHIDATTYYIYEWTNTDDYLLFPALPEPHTENWYCILLEFDEDDKLISHDIQTRSAPYFPRYRHMNYCLRVFPSLNTALAPSRLVKDAGIYCPNADLGHSDAQFYIGNLYYNHVMLEQDLTRAYVWYSLAAMNEHGQAASLLKEVKSQLTPGQLSVAQKQLEMWKPGKCQQNLMEAAHKMQE